jgi:F-type H+-transporting ATPase subunit alpha
MRLSHQILQLYAGINGYMDDLPVDSVRDFCDKLLPYAEKHGQEVVHEIETKMELTEDLEKNMKALLQSFKHTFVQLEHHEPSKEGAPAAV